MIRTAVVAKRTDSGHPDTAEIRRLAEAAGAEVVGQVTQTRPRDPGLELGAGAVSELSDRVAGTGADTVVVDAALTPRQSVNLEQRVDASVLDRHRVVLEIFADQARTRPAQVQVELARLRYRLPRVRERADEGVLNRVTESGTPYYDLRDRIDELERKLDACPPVDDQHRTARREQGFSLVALAGYTNAGKTTLFRRLADDLALETDGHDDLAETAGVADRLFETLETTTRRATLDGREVLLTDTVGFLDELPHWLVESLRGTLREVTGADVVVLVAALDQPVEELRRKLETARDTLGADHPPVVTVLNKADRLEEEVVDRRREAVADLAPDSVVASATAGELSGIERGVARALPDLDRAELTLPQSDETMSLVSWLHETASEVDVDYGPDAVVASVAADPATVRRAETRAADLR